MSPVSTSVIQFDLQDVSVRFGAREVLKNVDLQIAQGDRLALIGANGSGKSTLLRVLHGLISSQSGQSRQVGQLSGCFSTHENVRQAMLFQRPHMLRMRAQANVALAAWLGGTPWALAKTQALAALQRVGLDGEAHRPARALSQGQQQRLALARALTMEPALLLLDEPLSNLDAKLRERMRFELKRLQRELQITTVYVTHDQSEALALSHEIAVMNEGRIMQIGSPREIYERPRNKFVADFVGTTNFLEATISAVETEPGRYMVESPIGKLAASSADVLRAGDKVVLSLRPEDVELAERAYEGPNSFHGIVDAKVFLGEYLDFQIKVGDRTLLAKAHPSLRTPIGDKVFIRINADKCVAIPDSPRA